MHVWITRSQPGAGRQAAALEGRGHRALVAPVVTICEVSGAPPRGVFSELIFLSEHAVRFGIGRLLTANFDLSSVRVFAIGSSTAARLAEAGVAALIAPVASSEGVLAMADLTELAGKGVLIIAGVGGRDVLAPVLIERGARVEKLDVYRRQAVDEITEAVPEVDAIAVASGDGFEFMARLWFAAGGRGEVPVLVPSQRIADFGDRLGFSVVHTCAGAGVDALLDGLRVFEKNG